MAAGKMPLYIEKGATFRRVLPWTQLVVGGTPVDLTGKTARMQIREEVGSPTAILTLTTENDRITLGGTAGTIALYIPASVTAAITQDEAVYDLEIVTPDTPEDDVFRLLEGPVKFSPEATRDA